MAPGSALNKELQGIAYVLGDPKGRRRGSSIVPASQERKGRGLAGSVTLGGGHWALPCLCQPLTHMAKGESL